MRVRNNRLYPYPILSNESEDYKDNTFNADIETLYDSENAEINIKINLNDETIRKMIDEKKLSLFCHVDCSSTKYRRIFDISKSYNNASICIPTSKLIDSVEISCTLVTNENIENYTNENLSELYDNENILLPANSYVGFVETEEIYIIKKIDEKGDVPSIFNITKDDKSKNISHDTSGDKIDIFLPSKEYDTYTFSVGKNNRLRLLMTIYPVLVDIIGAIASEKIDTEGKAWALVLEESLKKKGYSGFDDSNFKEKNADEIAQELLDRLVNKAFSEYDALNSQR